MKVVIIGAGAIGLSSAYYLRTAGADVTVADQTVPGSKASAHNAGWVVPSMSFPVPAPGMLPHMTWREALKLSAIGRWIQPPWPKG